MKNKDAFSSFHPIINFLFFALVLLYTMCFLNPISLVISFLCGVLYHITLSGRKAVRFSLVFMLPVLMIAAIANPAFNHEGATILTYFPSGNPLTLESILYGLAAAMMLAAAMSWFACYTAVMTSDKFVYLFGRIIPALSLVLSMTLRFVPKFKAQFMTVRDSQKCIGRDISNGNAFEKFRNAVTITSIMITWALENAIETADSMKSRGYGLPGRTAYSIYRFDSRDKAALLWLMFCAFYITAAWIAGGFYWRWYPTIKSMPLTPLTVSFQVVYLALCLTGVTINSVADYKWKRIARGEPGKC